MNRKISIHMQNYGRGWIFKATFVDEAQGEMCVIDRRTNRAGDGLWAIGTGSAPDVQILGTCQFSLDVNRKTAYKQIRRYIVKAYGEFLGVSYG